MINVHLGGKGLKQKVSILTLHSRRKLPIKIGKSQKARKDEIRGQAKLILSSDIKHSILQ